jgi:hypothetical protein
VKAAYAAVHGSENGRGCAGMPGSRSSAFCCEPCPEGCSAAAVQHVCVACLPVAVLVAPVPGYTEGWLCVVVAPMGRGSLDQTHPLATSKTMPLTLGANCGSKARHVPRAGGGGCLGPKFDQAPRPPCFRAPCPSPLLRFGSLCCRTVVVPSMVYRVSVGACIEGGGAVRSWCLCKCCRTSAMQIMFMPCTFEVAVDWLQQLQTSYQGATAKAFSRITQFCGSLNCLLEPGSCCCAGALVTPAQSSQAPCSQP